MSAPQNLRLGILLVLIACVVFSAQDAMSRYLGGHYSVFMIIAIRFWAFALFVLLVAARAPGGLRRASASAFPKLQLLRGVLLALEVVLIVLAFVKLGLIPTHAVFICNPLLVSALSGPILGEKVGWRRWAAVVVGFIGVMVILQPGSGVFTPWALLPFAAAAMFAVYTLLTRYVAREDSATVSFFWTGIGGALVLTPFGLWFWEPMAAGDWFIMLCLCATAITGHWFLIRAYEVAEASALQPFAYLQLPMVALVGLIVFGEVLELHVLIGALIVIAAGLFTLWRQRQREKEGAPGKRR